MSQSIEQRLATLEWLRGDLPAFAEECLRIRPKDAMNRYDCQEGPEAVTAARVSKQETNMIIREQAEKLIVHGEMNAILKGIT